MRDDSPADQFLLARANGSMARAATPKRLIHGLRPGAAELARVDGDDDFHQTRELEDMRAGMTPKPRRVPVTEPAPSSEDPTSCPASS